MNSSSARTSRVITKSTWDFEQESTHCYTNCFHKYPAMMVPRVAEELVRRFGKVGGWCLDPFCGTGRSLVAARLGGMGCVGVDVNPLAVILSRVKLTPLSPDYLQSRLAEILARFDREAERTLYPSAINVSFWFSRAARVDLSRLFRAINYVLPRNSAAKDFFYVVLSETIRDVSWTRKSEFKLYKVPHHLLRQARPSVARTFELKANRNIDGMASYRSALGETSDVSTSKVFFGDIRSVEVDALMKEQGPARYDLVLTSPPYGDSITTVDYGNFSRLTLAWLALDEAFCRRWDFDLVDISSINRRCLGGVANALPWQHVKSAHECLRNIRRRRASRARVVSAYLADLEGSLASIRSRLTAKGRACFVIANRRVCGVEIPLSDILVDMGVRHGMRHVETVTRHICGKRLPRRINTNSRGIGRVNTMTEEFIVTLANHSV